METGGHRPSQVAGLGILTLAGWVATFSMAVLGAKYLWSCVAFLASPGVPVHLDYDAAGGKGRLDAEGYTIDIWKRTAEVRSASLRNPQGLLVAKASLVTATWKDNSVSVETQDLKGQVIRGSNGQFNFSTALPKSKAGGIGPSVELKASHAELRYVDQSAQPSLARTVVLDDVSMVQGGGDILVKSDVSVDTVRSVTLHAQVSPDGQYWVKVSGLDSDASTLVPVAQRYVDTKSLGRWGDTDLGKLHLKGWVEVTSGPGDLPDVRGDLAVASPSVRIGRNGFTGSLDSTLNGSLKRSTVDLSLKEPGRSLSFSGLFGYEKTPDLRGRFTLASSSGRLWPPLAEVVPKGTSFRNAKSEGNVSFVSGRLVMFGKASVGSAAYTGESVKNVAAKFQVSKEQFTLGIDKASWRGGPVSGTLQANLRTGGLLGVADLKDRSLAETLSPFGVKNVTGTGSLKAIIQGSVKAPLVDLLAQGTARIGIDPETVFDTGRFEARAHIKGQTATLQRLVMSGPNGVVAATGSLDFKSHVLQGDIMAGAVPLSALHEEAGGTGFIRGEVHGTTANPAYSARFEAYGAKWKDKGVAQVIGQLHGDKSLLNVDRISLLSGTGSADGKGEINLSNKDINGKFTAQNMSLSEYLGQDYLGYLQVSDGRISGTLDKPVVMADLSGKRVTAYGTTFDSVMASVSLENDVVKLKNALAILHDGRLMAQGDYGLTSQKGKITGSLNGLALSDLLLSNDDVRVTGNAKGDFELDTDKSGWSAVGNFDLANVGVNGSPLGSGSLALSSKEGVVHVTGDIGSVDRFVSFTDLAIDPKDKAFSADVSAYNLRLNDLILATRPYWVNSWQGRPDWFEQADGSFSGQAVLKANPDAWSLGPSDLTLDNLVIAGRDAGKFSATVTREGDKWDVPSATWVSDGSTLQGGGSLKDDGTIDVKASLTDFDLSWLKALLPDTPLITGKATATIVAAGPKDNPTGRASLLVDRAIVTYSDGQKASDPIQLLLDDLSFGKKTVTVGGHVSYAGFSGAISGVVPYSSLDSNPDARRQPLTASLKFDDRPLSDFKDQIADIDFDKSDGRIHLAATVTGFLDDLKIAADANFESSRLTLKSLDTELDDVKFSFNQLDRHAVIKLFAKSAKGGNVDAELSANLAHVFGSDFDVDALLDDSTLSGQINADGFMLAQKLQGAKDPTLAKIDGALTIAGSLRNPLVGGNVGVEQLIVRLPQEVVNGTAAAIVIDPTFDNVKVSVASGSKIETALGPLVVRGDGVIGGSLSEPAVNVPLYLESGNFRLPSGRISLEPGGQIIVSYNSLGGGEPIARVDLDIEGHTNVVARSGTGQYEPYRINLGIQGNALDDRNLRLTAVADPPNLSQDEVMALIGQRDLIQGLAAGVLGGPGESENLRNAFYSFAIPGISQNLTQGIASGLKLDFLSVDYNPFDQVILSAGKTIGKGLVLQVTRQLQGTEFAPPRYEVKLVYRLPVADRFLSRVTMGLGFDQSVPIKLTFNWSKKF